MVLKYERKEPFTDCTRVTSLFSNMAKLFFFLFNPNIIAHAANWSNSNQNFLYFSVTQMWLCSLHDHVTHSWLSLKISLLPVLFFQTLLLTPGRRTLYLQLCSLLKGTFFTSKVFVIRSYVYLNIRLSKFADKLKSPTCHFTVLAIFTFHIATSLLISGLECSNSPLCKTSVFHLILFHKPWVHLAAFWKHVSLFPIL